MEYAYRVGGRDYRGSRIQWGALTDLPSRSAAAKVVGHYQTGNPIKVYYDPRQPRGRRAAAGTRGRNRQRSSMIAPVFALFGLFYLGLRVLRLNAQSSDGRSRRSFFTFPRNFFTASRL